LLFTPSTLLTAFVIAVLHLPQQLCTPVTVTFLALPALAPLSRPTHRVPSGRPRRPSP
jgi:hypothetical protein